MADANDPDQTIETPMSNREILAWLWPLFRPYWKHFFGAFVLLVSSALLMISGPWLVKRAIDVDIAGADLLGLRATVLLYLGVQIAYLLVVYVMRNWLEWSGQNMMADLRRRVFDHLLKLPLAFHDRHTPGKLMSRTESDTQALRMLFTTTGVILLSDLLLFIGMFVVMAMVSLRLTLVMSLLLPSLLGVTYYYQRQVHPIFIRVRKQNSIISGRLTEFLHTLPVIRSMARGDWALATFQKQNQEKFQINFLGQKLIIRWFNLLFLIETFAFAAILGLGGYWALMGLVTIGTLAMFIGYVRRFFQPLFRLSEQLAVIQKAFAAAQRVFRLLAEPLLIEDPKQPHPWPGLNHEIRFEGVWFHYDGSENINDDSENWVLRNVSFTIPAGQRFALIGATGSGKTTIVSLLLRFYDPQRGRISIDNIDIRDMPKAELRQHIGLVMQDIYLFPGDLLDNLSLGGDGSPEQIESAARVTMADRFIQKLPGGYHAELSEGGENLSVGERQLLSFTRALARDPQLLILDEATSAVDPATEATIGNSMRKLFTGRTALIIAHRLLTIRDCDCILVMQQGEIVERGTHDELVNRGGLYHTFHQLQFSENVRAS